jgi:signal transduction histidine kinase
LELYRRQRLGLFSIVAAFLAVVGGLAVTVAGTVEARDSLTRGLELESHLSAFRVWVNRGSTDVLASILSPEFGDEATRSGDELRARAELVEIGKLVEGSAVQKARLVELGAILERRIAVERSATAAARTSGPEGGRAILAASSWAPDRARVRTITSAMIDEAKQGLRSREARYASRVMWLRSAMAAGVALILATLAFLLRQLGTARRVREEALRAHDLASQRLADLEGVLDTVPAAVLIARDRECTQISRNHFAEVLFRVPGGVNLSKSADEGVRPGGVRILCNGVEVPTEDLPLQASARTSSPVENRQLDLAFDDGTVRHVLATAHPLLDPSGAARGAVAGFVDVTETVRVAHELLATLDRNRTLLASAHRNELLYREMARNFPNGAISLFDHDLRFLIFDGTQFAIHRDAATNVGRTIREIFPPDIAARIEPVHREALEGRPGLVEVVINGRHLEIRASPVRDETGAVIMGIATSQDMTEERALRTQLAVSSRMASMGTLVAGVAHEVNNPLAGTLGSLATAIGELRAAADGLRGGAPVEREPLARALDGVIEVLLDAQVGGNRISRIVKDLTVFGRPSPVRTRVRLGDVVTSSMRWIPASMATNVTVQVDDLGAPDVHASTGQLEQVVLNLVTNAALAFPKGRRGEVTIRIFTSGAGRAVLEVKDDGEGIDPAIIERIFDPFFTTREVGQGMGLGLPICHAIVAAHDGTLTVESAPGHGSTFRVELPPVVAHDEANTSASRV